MHTGTKAVKRKGGGISGNGPTPCPHAFLTPILYGGLGAYAAEGRAPSL